MSALSNSNAIDNGGAYTLSRSLRFRSSASAYLSRTPTVAGNRQIWTISFWWKRGVLSSEQYIISADTAGANETWLRINAADTLQFQTFGGTNANLTTSAVFRDPSAWYHIVMAYDSTQATAGNRFKLYVNGTQQTLTGTNPTLNESQAINNTVSHQFCRRASTSGSYADNYLTEVYLIDGQALTPSSFGATNPVTGVWAPLKYSGTYGTNGFYLPFSNNSTASTLCYDFSGNNNNWAPNNISVTAGTTYDSMTDVPTLSSPTTANYAVLNPILQNAWWAAPSRGTITNGNLTHASGGNTTAFGNFDFVANSGKWYYEVTCGATDSSNTIVIAAQSRSTFEVGYYQNGQKQINSGTPSAYGSSWTSGDVIGVAIDVPNNTITFYKNNVSQGAISNTFPTGQPVYGGSYYNTSSGDYNYNFGQRPFTYTPPTDYVALNTYNLPTSTIVQGNKYMDATLYTGNGYPTSGTQSITNAASFKPDFIWAKARSAAASHTLSDSVRGTNSQLFTNNTAAQETNTDYVTSFNSNGFSLGTGTSGIYGNINSNGTTYVAWQWQAGQGTTSTNTSGTITSTVSVNASAGFSVVTYTGTGANATVGHGLGVAPKMVIVKNRSFVYAWRVWQTSLTSGTYYLTLNATDAQINSSAIFTATPSSTVFSVGNDNSTNGNTHNMVAYCWAEIAGFSKFGSFTGNGSADGPFVFTNFTPKFIMIKVSSAINGWLIYDTARNTYNYMDLQLYPNLSNAESQSSTYAIDALSNGFKLRDTGAGINGSGATFIYAAFAESPFKNALAR